jgi:diguanylate cyclase (GGDEF)-like protein
MEEKRLKVTLTTDTTSGATAAEIAAAVSADDLFVFRRIGERRYAHLGGAGRGAGWAGIIEIGLDEEPFVAGALAAGEIVRRVESEPWNVLGPYYGRSIAVVPVSGDVFVVFGASDAALGSAEDHELLELGQLAGETLLEVAPAKRLADELEAITAVKDLLHGSAETFEHALERLVEGATAALSCDVGLVYVPEGERIHICDRRSAAAPLQLDEVKAVLRALSEREASPACVQSAAVSELPAPLRSTDGVVSYYLLQIARPLPGLLLLLHTDASAARGFTQLCQALGHRLVEASEPLLHGALLRDSLRDQLERAEAAARHDSLTGLPNRLAWVEGVSAAQRRFADPASVIKLDCRGLKRVNERLGHREGDRLLCTVAGILAACVGERDLAARLGGDEFSLLLCGADETEASTVVSEIQRRIEGVDDFGGIEIRLSIGAATARDGDLEAAELAADSRMLEAKRLGRAAAGAALPGSP